MKKRQKWIVLVIAVLISTGLATYLCCFRGVNVHVENHSRETMHNVSIHVTEKQHFLGSLKPGSSESARVNPTGESRVDVEYTDQHGQVRRLIADCYSEGGNMYHGNIQITVGTGGVENVLTDLRLSPL